MKVVRCKNGHFFDQDKFDRCPYCNEAVPGSVGGNQISADDDVTVSFDEEKTSSYKDTPTFTIGGLTEKEEEKGDDEEKTVGLWSMPGDGKDVKQATVDTKPDDDEEKTVGFWTLPGTEEDKTAPADNGANDDDEKTVSFWDLNKEKETAGALHANRGSVYGTYMDGVTVPVNEESWITQPPEPPKENAAPVAGWLVCVEGPCRGRDYRLVEGRNFIGRSKEMDICIPEDVQLSRDCHCSVIYDPRSYRFVVLPGSSAASRLNGENIDGPVDLKDGDILCCGSTKLCFIGYCKEGREWK